MNYDLSDKIVLITGAARGVGKATAKRFLEAKATVFITDIDDDEGNNALQELISLGRVIYLHMDISIEDDIKNVINKIINQFNKLDIAINNSPFMPPKNQLGNYDIGQVKKTIDVDLIGVYNCMKYEIKEMTKQKKGSIVNISSIAGIKGIKEMSIFSAAKHGIIGLTKSAALEYSKQNIRINAICPGITATESFNKIKNSHPDYYEFLINLIPTKKCAQPSEIANAILWLASEEASYVNGSIITIDEGLSI